eukprot:1785124-Alexandrium_andersonii.AAC.1
MCSSIAATEQPARKALPGESRAGDRSDRRGAKAPSPACTWRRAPKPGPSFASATGGVRKFRLPAS